MQRDGFSIPDLCICRKRTVSFRDPFVWESSGDALSRSARQLGVAIPGGADGLVHFRTLLEKHLLNAEDAIGVIDVDFKNAFPSLEWNYIRRVVDEVLSELNA